jgi:antitoxin component of RelBE/YafQ-DinJ toxin-antitoxin module
MFSMSETATLSTVIDADVKAALINFCKRRGIKMRYLIEQALIEQLENEIDLEAFKARRNEETIPLEKVLSKLNKRKK